tara:strand:- start:86 stop:343 length:258 start_codon:yes stop_codon:yes gene_type:complete
MANKILVEVDDKGVVTYDFNIDNAMTMLIGLVDAMNHNSDLASIIDGACDARITIKKAQDKAIDDDFDKAQIDLFEEAKRITNES